MAGLLPAGREKATPDSGARGLATLKKIHVLFKRQKGTHPPRLPWAVRPALRRPMAGSPSCSSGWGEEEEGTPSSPAGKLPLRRRESYSRSRESVGEAGGTGTERRAAERGEALLEACALPCCRLPGVAAAGAAAAAAAEDEEEEEEESSVSPHALSCPPRRCVL